MPTGASRETDELKPRNPYAASKAGADRLAYSYWATYGVPVIVTRASNNYGPYQFPEKVIPLFVTNAIDDQPVPLYGDGLNVRDWLHVARPLPGARPGHRARRGRRGLQHRRRQRGGERRSDAGGSSALLGRPESLIRPVADRPGHDRRYCLDTAKLRGLGWQPQADFDDGLAETVDWYRQNEWWWRPIKHGRPGVQGVLRRRSTAGRRQNRASRRDERPRHDRPSAVAAMTAAGRDDRPRHRRRRVCRQPPARPARAGRPAHRRVAAAGRAAAGAADRDALPVDGRRHPRRGRRAAGRSGRSRPALVYHLAGIAHVGRLLGPHVRDARGQRPRHAPSARRARRARAAAARILVSGLGARLPRAGRARSPSRDPVGPGSPYGLSKLAQEMTGAHAALEHGLPVRADAVVQPHRPAAGSVVLRVERGPPDRAHRARARRSRSLEVGNLEARRDLTDVRDTVRAYRAIAERGVAGPRLQRVHAARPTGSATSSTRCCRGRASPIAVRPRSGALSAARRAARARRPVAPHRRARLGAAHPDRADAVRPAGALATGGARRRRGRRARP